MKRSSKKGTFVICILIVASFMFSTGFTYFSFNSGTPKYMLKNEGVALPFNDLAGNAAEAAVMESYARGVMNGYKDGSFKPRQSVTKLETVVMLSKLLGLEPGKEDIANGEMLAQKYNIPQWAAGYVCVALENSIVTPEDIKSLKNAALRQDVAVLAVKALGLEKQVQRKRNQTTLYTDAANISDKVKGYINVAGQRGIVKGYSDGKYRPLSPVTRGEIAFVLCNIANNGGGFSFAAQPESGLIKDVDVQNRSFNITNMAEKEVKINLLSNYIIYLNGRRVSLDALATGQYAVIIDVIGKTTVVIAKTSLPDEGVQLNFEQINEEQSAPEIRNWVDQNKTFEKVSTMLFENKLYLLVCRGEKMTAGYSIDITNLLRTKDDQGLHYKVKVEMSDPAKGDLVSQRVSYPYALVCMDAPSEKITDIIFLNELNQKLGEIK